MKNVLTLRGECFKRQYMVYVIELIDKNKHHYYVGQTGDHKYVTARSAIYRLLGHLGDQGQSTQNQIYRYVAGTILGIPEGYKREAFADEIKGKVEKFFVNNELKMYFYKLQDLKPQIDRIEHLAIVRKVMLFEKFVMEAFVQNHKILINKNYTRPRAEKTCPYPKILKQIKKTFKMET